MSVRTFVQLGCALGLVAATLSGCECAPSGGRRGDAGRGPDGSVAAGEVGGQCLDTLDNDMDGVRDCADPDCYALIDCQNVDTGVPRVDGGFAGCEGDIYDARNGIAPVDIVWVIDNSGSMNEEASLIQDRMNDFAAAITSSGITDYHVVVMTAEGWVNVPAPLGTDPTHFLFVNEDVQSSEPLEDALARLSAYEPFLRPEAILHFVFVTDDESSLSADDFQDRMEAALLRPFTANVIASPPMGGMTCTPPFCFEMGCTGPHGDAAAPGAIYWELATQTSGLRLSICAEDWTGLFDELTALVAVPTRIPCRFEIPPPPAGETFDRNRVNLVFTPSPGADGVTIPRASDGCDSGRGWIYDDDANPRNIILCPSECALVEGAGEGQVNVQFGCATILI